MSATRGLRVAVLLGLLIGAATWSVQAAAINLTSQAFTPYRTCTITATPATTTAVIDTTVRQATAGSNFGTLTSLTVSSASAANQRVYLKFDLSLCNPALPASATVRVATLRLYLTAVPAACRTIDIFAVTSAWTETGVTWTSQPFGTTINNPATGSRTGSFNAGTPAGCQNQAANAYAAGAVVTTDVARFVVGTASNFGWMLRDDAEGSSTTRTTTFASKELGTITQDPQLIVTYVVVP